MRFSTSGFFHKSVGPRPLIHILKLFRIWPRFRGVISESVFFSCHFPDHKSGKWSLSGYCYPESDHFPDSNIRKVILKWIISFFPYLHCLFVGKKEFEHFSLSGYCYPESDHFPDSNNRKVNTFRLLLSGKWISRKSVKNNFF